MNQGVDTEDLELAEWVILNVWWYSKKKMHIKENDVVIELQV